MSRPPIVFSPPQPRTLHAFGDEITILHDATTTGGELTTFISRTPPGGGPPPHFHTVEDEWFYPLEGQVEFFCEGEWTLAQPGSMVYAPKNSIHTFRNAGDSPARTLIQLSPSGFETFFEKCAEEFAREGGPDMQRIVEISAEHNIFFPEP